MKKQSTVFEIGDTSDTEVKYDGRTIKVTLLANTDEDLTEFVERIKKAAKEKGAMLVIGAGVAPSDTARTIWENIKAEADSRRNRAEQ